MNEQISLSCLPYNLVSQRSYRQAQIYIQLGITLHYILQTPGFVNATEE